MALFADEARRRIEAALEADNFEWQDGKALLGAAIRLDRILCAGETIDLGAAACQAK